MKKQLTAFIETNNIIDKQMHGARKGHSIVTAKIAIDEDIMFHKDKGHKIVLLKTDLTAAYDTVGHSLLLSKMEQIGIRENELKIFTSYPKGRNFFTKVQGFLSKIYDLPATSVVQGSKLSSLLYTIFKKDTSRYGILMKNKELFQKITGRAPLEDEILSHQIFTYMDDTQHIIAAKTHKDIKNYIHDLHMVLITMYKNNSLSINGDKTEFMNLFTNKDEDADAKFKIPDKKGNIIEQQNTMKILGYEINNNNTMEAHMCSLMSKMAYSHFKLKGAIPYMSTRNKKIILEAKIKSQLNLTLPLMLNQNQRIQKKGLYNDYENQ